MVQPIPEGHADVPDCANPAKERRYRPGKVSNGPGDLFPGDQTMIFDDKSIPVKCGECDHESEGVKDMECHICIDHSDLYTPKEARKYARLWAEDAYENDEEREREFTRRNK